MKCFFFVFNGFFGAFEVVCGDGQVNGDEECDDGNTTDGDGCDSSCAVEDDGTGTGTGTGSGDSGGGCSLIRGQISSVR